MCSFFLLFLSFPLLGANVNAKKRRETTSTRREREGERERRARTRAAKMMEGAAVAMISALAKTTSAIEANGRRRATRLEGWMHSAWKIMRSYAQARASWIMQGGYISSLVPIAV